MHPVILVCGPAGAGKTTYAKKLADQLGAVLLDSDQVSQRLIEAALALAGLPTGDRDSPAYKQAFREPVYETLFDLAQEHRPRGPVVLAGPFTREARDPDWADHLQSRLLGPVEIHFVWCDPSKRQKRLKKRGLLRDVAKLADWEAFCGPDLEQARPIAPHRLIRTDESCAD